MGQAPLPPPSLDPPRGEGVAAALGWTPLLENLPLGLLLVDATGHVAAVNGAACRILAEDRATLLAHDPAALLGRWVAPGGRSLTVQDLVALGSREPEATARLGWLRAKGGTLWFDLSAEILSMGGFLLRLKEAAVEHDQDLFSKVFSACPDAITITSMEDGTFLEVNQVMLDLMELSREEVIGHSSRDLQAWVDPEDRRHYLEEVTRNGFIRNYETHFRVGSGRILPFRVSSERIQAEGRSYSLNFITNMTERRMAEATLKQEKEKYQGLIEHMHSGFILMEVILDPDGNPVDHRLLEVNAEFETQSGLKRESELGKTSADLSFQWPTDIVKKYYEVALGGVPLILERFNESLQRFYDIRAFSPVRGQWGMLFNDITQRKGIEEALRVSEAQWRALTEQLQVGVLTQAPTSEVLQGNEKALELLGLTRDQLLGRTAIDPGWNIIHEDGTPFPASTLPVPQAVATLQPIRGVVMGVYRPVTQDRAWLLVDAIPQLNEQGGLRQVVCTFSDITVIRKAELERERLSAELEQMQKMESLGRLAGGLAHDMNNVLGAILALATAHLAIQPKDDATYPTFETIRDAAARGGEVVKRLLTFARQNPVERRELDLNALLLEGARLLARTTLAKVRLDLDLAPDLRPIRGDGSALAHVLMNICVNAVDAMNEGGSLTFHTQNVGEDRVEVEITDTGTGMTRDVLDRAMDPYFTTKDVGKGTGLGLSMAFTTVKAHGGELKIQSEPGKGTRVRLRFPATVTQDLGPEPLPPTPLQPVKSAMAVLLIDDDELIQKSTRMLVEALGHTVTSAASGEEALAGITRGLQPDVVILDMNMPGLGGKGTLPRLRHLCPAVPVLLATGRVDQEALDLVAAHPAVTLMSKPFSFEELREHLVHIRLGEVDVEGEGGS